MDEGGGGGGNGNPEENPGQQAAANFMHKSHGGRLNPRLSIGGRCLLRKQTC